MSVGNIGKSAIISYIAIVLNIAISFLYTPWMLHKIGVSDYGLYSLVLSFISYFVMDFGLGGAISRFIAKYRAEGESRKVENILGLTLRIFLYIDIAILICLLVCYLFLTDIFKGLTVEELEKLKVLYVIASAFSVMSFALKPFEGTLTAYEYFIPAKVLDMAYKVGSVLFVVVALELGGNIYHLVLINGLLALCTSLYRYVYWHRKTHLTPNLRFADRSTAKSVFSFSGWTFLIGLAQRFRLNLIPTVLGIFSNSSQIAVFALAMTMEAMIWTLSSALNGLFLPKVSRMVHEGDDQSIMDLMVKVGRIQLFIISVIFSGFFVCGETFIRLWVGQDFADVYYIVLCLIFTYLISTTTQIAVDKIYAENKVKFLARTTFSTSLLGVVGSCFVAGRFGALGCACCSGIALVATQFFYLRIYRKRAGIDIGYFLRSCHLKIMPLVMVISVLFWCVFNYVKVNNWMGLIIGVALYVLLFSFMVYRFLFNEYEKDLFRSLLRIK